MSLDTMPIDLKAINTIRTLAMDGVQKANSGHPGTPMALAPLAYHLYHEVMRYNPSNPGWPDRDRFVLSCGHASMLIYSMLHLTGFGLTVEDLKNFRQWGSLTPGHPEVRHTAGIETTTGPLGQGLSTAVGMAIAETRSAARYNVGDHRIVDHTTYVICSDGDLMEGITSEACSLAGHLKLGKLIAYWDDNKITIDGSTDLAFTEDVARRYEAYGWHVQHVDDVNDLDALRAATAAARAETSRPSMIVVRTVIGYGSPNKAGTSSAHGSPLGAAEIALTKSALGWPEDASFFVPEDALAHMREAVSRGTTTEIEWAARFAVFAEEHPELAAEFERRLARALPEGWDDGLPRFSAAKGGIATRKSSQKVLEALMDRIPELVGGSADLAGSNGTQLQHYGIYQADKRDGRMFCFGVREHAMGAIAAGMSLHGDHRTFGAGFLIFSDYMRGAIRLASLMGEPIIYILTHDSIAIGEDGPTHQPIEHLAALRVIPNLHVFRPADANETTEGWKHALRRTDGPTVLILTRQGLPVIEQGAEGAARGAYIHTDVANPDMILVATGSEVGLAAEAQKVLSDKGISARVVSMPCREIFEAQDAAYRESVLPKAMRKRLCLEAGVTYGWREIATDDGDILGIDTFGHSAPGELVMERYGFSVDNVVARAEAMLSR